MLSRSLGLVAGFAADHFLGDPRRFHPVAGFGQLAAAVEQRTYADNRLRGALHTILLVGSSAAAGRSLDRATIRRPLVNFALTATTTWAVLGGRSLGREGMAVYSLLDSNDLSAAREQLTHLVGRDTSQLDESEIARATIESVAENTSDAVVAPLVAGALGGIGGLMSYRAANTLDAMVGHRNPRYEQFGWASARLDDLLNLLGSRLTALLAVAFSPNPSKTLKIWRRDARYHPSPNAGPVEAAFAGSLGITLGGVNRYGSRLEDRHTLGDGPPPVPRDIERAVKLATRIDLAAALTTTIWPLVHRMPPRRLSPWPKQRRSVPGGLRSL